MQNLTKRQFVAGGIVLFVLMLLINLALPLDTLLRILTIIVGVVGLVVAFVFGMSQPKNEPEPPEEV
jgi:hydrogenase/urease accessory protein HupE